MLHEGISFRKERLLSQRGRNDLKASPPHVHLAEQGAITARRGIVWQKDNGHWVREWRQHRQNLKFAWNSHRSSSYRPQQETHGMHFTAYEFNLLFFKKDKMLKSLTLKCSENGLHMYPLCPENLTVCDCNVSSDFKGHVHPKKPSCC